MLAPKKEYINILIESSGLGLKISGIRDLVDDCVESYLDSHAKITANGWDVKDNTVTLKLEQMLHDAFTKNFLWHLYRSEEYKKRVAMYIDLKNNYDA